MSPSDDHAGDREDGLRLLEARNAAIPALLADAFSSPVDEAAIAASIGTGVVATGAGSSAAHARFLASVLAELGVAARFAPLTELVEAPAGAAARQTLVVFSQGLSPNARLALRHAASWQAVWLVTATGNTVAGAGGAPGGDDEARRRAVEEAAASGVHVLPYPGAGEFGTLLRIVGPMTGHAAALRFAIAASGARPAWHEVAAEDVCHAVAGAAEKLQRVAGGLCAHDLERNLSLVASGVHTARVENLRLKFLEATLRPAPPLWDLLDLAHGPFQQMFAGRSTILAFTRADARGEDELLARLSSMLEPDRHRLVRLPSALPGPLAVFEHEALMNELVLRYMRERRIDPRRWPGKDADGPLYSYGGRAGAEPARESHDRSSSNRRLEDLTWPELDAILAKGGRTAILPLGSIEQHGPHLPFATDAWIAGELARRLCARIPEAIELPVVPFGCASEHLGFPGTLSLDEGTFASVLCDLASSVSRHGFDRLFVFSAHGGNRRALELAVPKMRAAAGGLRIVAAPGLGASMELFHRESARHDVSAEASGHHAGEFETSIMLAVAPQGVRTDRFAAGLAFRDGDADGLFYPDLRASAPDGTVGDPTGADAARADAYLEAWVESLLELYRREESWIQAKGRKNA